MCTYDVQAVPARAKSRSAEYRQLMLALDEAARTEIQTRLQSMDAMNEMHVAQTLSALLPPGRACQSYPGVKQYASSPTPYLHSRHQSYACCPDPVSGTASSKGLLGFLWSLPAF